MPLAIIFSQCVVGVLILLTVSFAEHIFYFIEVQLVCYFFHDHDFDVACETSLSIIFLFYLLRVL
jgi:hypothetical protein